MYLIVGCGLSGAVLAERLASQTNSKVLIIDKRDHIGGNCYDYVDLDTNIRVNKYGAHLFHTNNKRVWNYINKFSKWKRWEHTVVSSVDDQIVPVPVNITTVNKLCNQSIQTKEEMDTWLSNKVVGYREITNSEEMALSLVGEELYEKMFKNYTFKQWKKYPAELDKSVLQRIPVRNNFDTRYFTDKYQALPEEGYTKFFENLLNNPNIEVQLNVDFFEFKKNNVMTKFKKIIYTGPIDTYFGDCGYEKLEYRSIDFNLVKQKNCGYYQQNSVVNYPSSDKIYTRIVEYKHFLNQQSPHTIICYEVPCDEGEPYYPVPNKRNLELYEKYKNLSDEEKNVVFVGRLANYKYFNMDQAIANSLKIFDEIREDIYKPKKITAPIVEKDKIALVLRGHIRDTFDDYMLKNFIQKLCSQFKVDIYCHSWSETEAKLSYRALNRRNLKKVDRQYIIQNLDIQPKVILIEDDEKIKLNGQKFKGSIFSAGAPFVAWKRMWHGMYSICEKVPDNYNLVVNIRYDLFRWSKKYNQKITNKLIIDKCHSVLGKEGVHFLDRVSLFGVDNIYFGSVDGMKQLCYNFHYNLDELDVIYKKIIWQEISVFLESFYIRYSTLEEGSRFALYDARSRIIQIKVCDWVNQRPFVIKNKSSIDKRSFFIVNYGDEVEIINGISYIGETLTTLSCDTIDTALDIFKNF